MKPSYQWGIVCSAIASFVPQGFGGLRAVGPQRRVDGRGEGQSQGGDRNPYDVLRMRFTGDSRDVIDVGIHDVKAESPFEEGHDDLDVEAQRESQADPERGADPADQNPLGHEYAKHAARAHADSAQNRDVGAFVIDDHDQGRDDVEHGDRDDQPQNQSHHGFLDANGVKISRILLRPIAYLQARRQARSCISGQDRRVQNIVELETYSGGPIESAQRLGVGQLDEGEHTVMVLKAYFEDPGDLEVLQPRYEFAAAALPAARDHHRHRIAEARLQLVGERSAEHDPIRARLEIRELTLAHRLSDR